MASKHLCHHHFSSSDFCFIFNCRQSVIQHSHNGSKVATMGDAGSWGAVTVLLQASRAFLHPSRLLPPLPLLSWAYFFSPCSSSCSHQTGLLSLHLILIRWRWRPLRFHLFCSTYVAHRHTQDQPFLYFSRLLFFQSIQMVLQHLQQEMRVLVFRSSHVSLVVAGYNLWCAVVCDRA